MKINRDYFVDFLLPQGKGRTLHGLIDLVERQRNTYPYFSLDDEIRKARHLKTFVTSACFTGFLFFLIMVIGLDKGSPVSLVFSLAMTVILFLAGIHFNANSGLKGYFGDFTKLEIMIDLLSAGDRKDFRLGEPRLIHSSNKFGMDWRSKKDVQMTAQEIVRTLFLQVRVLEQIPIFGIDHPLTNWARTEFYRVRKLMEAHNYISSDISRFKPDEKRIEEEVEKFHENLGDIEDKLLFKPTGHAPVPPEL